MRALIDLDGTLIDTVYAHVFAWKRALAEAGLPIDGWRIHRRKRYERWSPHARRRSRGRSSAERRRGRIDPAETRTPVPRAVARTSPATGSRRPAGPSAHRGCPAWIATSGRRPEIDASLDALGVPDDSWTGSSSTSWPRSRSRPAPTGERRGGGGQPRRGTSSAATRGRSDCWRVAARSGRRRCAISTQFSALRDRRDFSVDDASHAFWLLDSYVYGHVVEETNLSRSRRRRPRRPVTDSSPTSESTTQSAPPHSASMASRLTVSSSS